MRFSKRYLIPLTFFTISLFPTYSWSADKSSFSISVNSNQEQTNLQKKKKDFVNDFMDSFSERLKSSRGKLIQNSIHLEDEMKKRSQQFYEDEAKDILKKEGLRSLGDVLRRHTSIGDWYDYFKGLEEKVGNYSSVNYNSKKSFSYGKNKMSKEGFNFSLGTKLSSKPPINLDIGYEEYITLEGSYNPLEDHDMSFNLEIPAIKKIFKKFPLSLHFNRDDNENCVGFNLDLTRLLLP